MMHAGLVQVTHMVSVYLVAAQSDNNYCRLFVCVHKKIRPF